MKRYVLVFMTVLLLSSCETIKYVYIENEIQLPSKINKIVLEQFNFSPLYEASPSKEYTLLLNELEKVVTINEYTVFAQEVKRMLRDIKVDQITKNMSDEDYELEYQRLVNILKDVNDEILALKKPTTRIVGN